MTPFFSVTRWGVTLESTSGTGKDQVRPISVERENMAGQKHWSFVNRPYNFDSAGGLIYKVDVTKPKGERVIIESLADGTAFDESASYDVAMTSYRASGGGNIMREGAGVDTDRIADRVVAYHPEIRDILYEYLVEHKEIDPATIGDRTVIGEWSFIPEEMASEAMGRDMKLMFRK